MRTTGIIAVLTSLIVLATAASSASAIPPLILVIKPAGVYPQLFLSESKKESKLRSLNASGSIVEKEIHCTSLLNHGFLRTPHDLLILLLFHNCLTEVLGSQVACKSAGETGSLIHVLLLALTVWLDAGHTLPGLLFEKHSGLSENIITEFSCSLLKIQWRATLLGHVKPAPKVITNKVEVNFETSGGLEQKFDKVEGTGALDHLEANESGGAFKPFTLEVLEDLIHFNEGVEIEFH